MAAEESTTVNLIRDLFSTQQQNVDRRFSALEDRLTEQAEDSRISRDFNFKELHTAIETLRKEQKATRTDVSLLMAAFDRYKWAAKAIRRGAYAVGGLLAFFGFRSETVRDAIARWLHAGGGN